MEKDDSTKTRVVPVFDRLLERDATGGFWLRQLMSLGSRASFATVPEELGPITNSLPTWGRGLEEKLPPPMMLLEWLVQNVSSEAVTNSDSKDETRRRRQALADGDSETLNEALYRLRQLQVGKPVGKGWFILEGNTSPDAFIETNTFILVVEGKHTESNLTSYTTWMKHRPQLIRHMDAATDVAQGRSVFGLLLVEGNPDDPMFVPEKWTLGLEQHIQPDRLAQSLPHRSLRRRQNIASSILGAATWQRVCSEFSITVS